MSRLDAVVRSRVDDWSIPFQGELRWWDFETNCRSLVWFKCPVKRIDPAEICVPTCENSGRHVRCAFIAGRRCWVRRCIISPKEETTRIRCKPESLRVISTPAETSTASRVQKLERRVAGARSALTTPAERWGGFGFGGTCRMRIVRKANFRRRLLACLSGLSLLLCLATVTVWVRSYWRFDGLFHNRFRCHERLRTAGELYDCRHPI
jgi:hypothetical protein